jgi:hypothetical protein
MCKVLGCLSPAQKKKGKRREMEVREGKSTFIRYNTESTNDERKNR